MLIELVGGPRDGERMDTQGHPGWAHEFPVMKGYPYPNAPQLSGKYVRTDRMIENRVVYEYKAVSMRVRFRDKEWEVVFEPYQHGGRPAIILLDEDGERFVASVNIPEVEIKPGHTHLKVWSGNEGVLEALEEAGIVRRTGWVTQTGFVQAPIVEILDKEVCKRFWP